MKYAWIDGQRKAYPLPVHVHDPGGQWQWLSGLEERRPSNGKRLRDPQLLALIRAIHAQLKGRMARRGW